MVNGAGLIAASDDTGYVTEGPPFHHARADVAEMDPTSTVLIWT